MLSAPTDKRYKFWAVLGLALFGFGVKTIVTAYDDGKRAELAFLQTFEPAQRAYSRYAESVNGAMAKAREYNANPSAETWKELQRYLSSHEKEIDGYQREAEVTNDQNQADLRAAEHAKTMAWIWLIIGIAMVSLGSVASAIGFRNWVRRERPNKSFKPTPLRGAA